MIMAKMANEGVSPGKSDSSDDRMNRRKAKVLCRRDKMMVFDSCRIYSKRSPIFKDFAQDGFFIESEILLRPKSTSITVTMTFCLAFTTSVGFLTYPSRSWLLCTSPS